MTAALRPGTTAGAGTGGKVRPRPTRREVESLLLKCFPGLSKSAANRSARCSTSATDPYAAAVANVRRRMTAGEFYNALGYGDPTGNTAASHVDAERRRRAA